MIFDDWAIPDISSGQGTWLDRYFDTPGGLHDDFAPFVSRGDDFGDFAFGPYAVIGHDMTGGSAVATEAPAGETPWDGYVSQAYGSETASAFDDASAAAALPFMVADTPFAIGGRPSYAMRMLMDSFDGGSLGRIWG